MEMRIKKVDGGMEIPIGKGKIILNESIKKSIEGKFLVLELFTEKGPCPDGMCQLLSNLNLRVQETPPDKSYHTISLQGFTVAMTDTVYRSIDRGRESVSINKGISGNFISKGFSPTI